MRITALNPVRHNGSGVYLLKRQGEIIYVGQSSCVLVRIRHHPVKDFDEVCIIWCHPQRRRRMERKLILKHAPRLNTNLKNPRPRKSYLALTHPLITKLTELKRDDYCDVENNQQRKVSLMIAARMGFKVVTRKLDGKGYRVWKI